MDEMRFELASQEALSFLTVISEKFMSEVAEHPEALITDESTLRDFAGFIPEDSVGPGSKPGTFIYRCKMVKRGRAPWKKGWKPNDPDNFEWKEIEMEAHDWRADYVQKTKAAFGVDITPVLDQPLPIIFHFIMKHTPPKN